MKRALIYIAALVMLGCAKTTKQSDVFVPEKIKTDTMYHIEALDGDLIYYDSIRYETRHFPEHYLRWISSDDCIVFIGTDTLTYEEYRAVYCSPVSSVTVAQCDTITNTHMPGFYKSAGVWAFRSIIRTGYRR